MSNHNPAHQPNPPKPIFPIVLWSVTCLLILAAIAGGLNLTGGPAYQRLSKLDERRVDDLLALESGISEYYTLKKVLPESLGQLNTTRYNLRTHLNDPETRQIYHYQKLSADRFKLCVRFATDAQDERSHHPMDYGDHFNFFQHPAGEHCFIRERLTDESKNGSYPRFRGVPE